MTTDNTNQATTKKSGRGRPRKDFTFPTGKFRVKQLADQLGISVPLVHLKIREAGDAVKVVGTESQGRGRAANVYLYTAPVAVPVASTVATSSIIESIPPIDDDEPETEEENTETEITPEPEVVTAETEW